MCVGWGGGKISVEHFENTNWRTGAKVSSGCQVRGCIMVYRLERIQKCAGKQIYNGG